MYIYIFVCISVNPVVLKSVPLCITFKKNFFDRKPWIMDCISEVTPRPKNVDVITLKISKN